jgi:predicted DNA-binding protein (MmcQ/YjbR family)
MHIEEFRDFCLSLPATTEGTPFGENVLVFKVMDKMFALTDIDTFESINLKCDPQVAIELREKYKAIKPGYHMNKQHWNTIMMDGELSDEQIKHWIKHSYELIIEKLPKNLKMQWRALAIENNYLANEIKI